MFQLHKDMVTGLLNHFPYEGLYPHNPVHAQRRFSGHQSDLELPQVWKTGSDATEAVDMFAVYFFYVIFLERGGAENAIEKKKKSDMELSFRELLEKTYAI